MKENNFNSKKNNIVSKRGTTINKVNGNQIFRSSSESAAYHMKHANDGHVTPGAPPRGARAGSAKEFSTPNTVFPIVISGVSPNGYDWGTSKPCDETTISMLKELNKHNCMTMEESKMKGEPFNNSLRRSITMDDRFLSKKASPSSIFSSSYRLSEAVEPFTPNNHSQEISSSKSNLPRIVSMPQLELCSMDTQAETEAGAEAEAEHTPYRHWSYNGGISSSSFSVNTLVDEKVITAARLALSRVVSTSSSHSDIPSAMAAAVANVSSLPQQQNEIMTRNRRRIDQSMNKKRRMSIGIKKAMTTTKTSHQDTFRSPATPAKCNNRKKKPTIIPPPPVYDDMSSVVDIASDSDDYNPFQSETIAMQQQQQQQQQHLNESFSANEFIFDQNSKLNEKNFKGVVIAGVYQHLFENGLPVIAPPSAYDKKVVSVSFANNKIGEKSLQIILYIPKDKASKTIDLGANWIWTRTANDGFLVSKEKIRENKKIICYYLPRHPVEWAAFNSNNPEYSYSNSNSNINNDSSLMCNDISFMSGWLNVSTHGRGGGGESNNFSLLENDPDSMQIIIDEPSFISASDECSINNNNNNSSSSSISFSLNHNIQFSRSVHHSDLNMDCSFAISHFDSPEGRLHSIMEEDDDPDTHTHTHFTSPRELSFVELTRLNPDWDDSSIVSCSLDYLFNQEDLNSIMSYARVSKSWYFIFLVFFTKIHLICILLGPLVCTNL